jgi:hypothetical protein
MRFVDELAVTHPSPNARTILETSLDSIATR